MEPVAKDKRETTRQAARLQSGGAFDGAGDIKVEAAIIRPARTRHGPRKNWREDEFAQLAIQALQGANPPQHQNYAKLHRDVNEWLRGNPDWRSRGFGEISRSAVLRALAKVHP
jgi:hypothetical protein